MFCVKFIVLCVYWRLAVRVQCLCLLQICCGCSVFVFTADWPWVFSVYVYCRLAEGVQCLCLLQIGCGSSVFVL